MTLEKDANYFRYAANTPFYAGSFSIRPAASRSPVRMLTSAELQNGVLSFHTRIDCQLLGPNANELMLSLSDWPADVRLDVSQTEVKSQYRRQGKSDHFWKISVPPGKLRPLALDLHGQVKLARGRRSTCPEWTWPAPIIGNAGLSWPA